MGRRQRMLFREIDRPRSAIHINKNRSPRRQIDLPGLGVGRQRSTIFGYQHPLHDGIPVASMLPDNGQRSFPAIAMNQPGGRIEGKPIGLLFRNDRRERIARRQFGDRYGRPFARPKSQFIFVIDDRSSGAGGEQAHGDRIPFGIRGESDAERFIEIERPDLSFPDAHGIGNDQHQQRKYNEYLKYLIHAISEISEMLCSYFVRRRRKDNIYSATAYLCRINHAIWIFS